MNFIIIDNYDSFTYNLVHIIEQELQKKVEVVKNDEKSIDYFKAFDKILISPGPGIPSESGIILEVIKEYSASKNILGVCLGHQAIGEVFGANLKNLSTCYHGVATEIYIQKESLLFKNLPKQFQAGRYHSWAIEDKDFPHTTLDIIAKDSCDEIMAIKHKKYNTWGIQFHPESILTPLGQKILKNWINI